ncbi:MAG TPA: glycosyltransferase family 2 protein [Candidatus Gastranaerophilaceae bacterium]|nr:glycosyltransferase family 2 protein [Candidatus Gastranaerophilaceae bacterium]HPT41916.1 glycosyltransferase family 2 protein [Candidatus Gastranaerophilaceae bacterium]
MEGFKIKVSVTIPTYNNLESFKRTLNSVLCQTFSDFEIIITDDSENDDIKIYTALLNDERIKYFKNPQKMGAPKNWNEGIKKAQGEYVKILHHDDWFADENSLKKFVELMDKNPQCDFGYSKSVDFNVETKKIKTRKAEKYVSKIEKNPFELYLCNRIGSPSVVIFRNKNDLLFDENLKWLVDLDLYIEALIRNNKIAFINKVLVNIGISQAQITNSCQDNQKVEIYELFYLYNKYKKNLDNNKYYPKLTEALKRFKICTLEKLREIIPQEFEIPERIINKLSGKKKCLKDLLHL